MKFLSLLQKFRSLKVCLLCVMALNLPMISQATADSLTEDLLGNLESMRTLFRAEYAPAEWKKQFAGYDLESEYKKAQSQIMANPALSLNEGQEILKNFIYAMKDYHVSISFVSTESASLPLVIKGTKTNYFIAFINREKLPKEIFPFNEGDEVVTFAGEPTAKAVNEVQAETPANVDSTDRAIAELTLTKRRASRGYKVPQGPVTLGIRAKGETQVREYQMVWEYMPELINPRQDLQKFSKNPAKKKSHLFSPMMAVDLGLDVAPTNPFAIGARKTFTPDLGEKIWESEEKSEFYAYIFRNEEGKLIGYVRIPAYIVTDYVAAIREFETVIKKFEKLTDAMVIDEVNNPGGSVFYLYALASMLSDQPLKTPRHRMALNQSDVFDALELIKKMQAITSDEQAKKEIPAEELNGYPVSYQFVQFTLNYANFLVSEWNAGRKLTTPYWIAGVDHINPATTHYTKPILVLVNDLDFSGGDFFPTILQDNKRVTVMGNRTAGAGGYVHQIEMQNNVGIDSYSCTESIAERVDGSPIENLGVTPDIAYEMSVEDFSGEFEPYKKAINTALSKLTP